MSEPVGVLSPREGAFPTATAEMGSGCSCWTDSCRCSWQLIRIALAAMDKVCVADGTIVFQSDRRQPVSSMIGHTRELEAWTLKTWCQVHPNGAVKLYQELHAI